MTNVFCLLGRGWIRQFLNLAVDEVNEVDYRPIEQAGENTIKQKHNLASCLAKAYMIPQIGRIDCGPRIGSSSVTQSNMASDHASIQEAEWTNVIPKLSTLTQTLIQTGEIQCSS